MTPTRAGFVLVIDDNVNFADNIAEILRIEGWDAEIAASGEEALSKALVRQPTIVVTDYRLPGMNGADFVRRYRQEHPHVVAVVISAYNDDRTIKAAVAVGAAFLPKPLDFAILSDLICRHEGSA
jgi:CheY-like chemotaxis protein